MLWKYALTYSGFIEAESTVPAARDALIEKLRNDPGAFISKIEPAEPVCPSLLKRVIGMQ